jgi:hypothetical protein
MSRPKGNGAPRAAATPEPAIYYKTPVTPEEAFQAIGRLRKEARDEIDRLIRFLDQTDNHMEREPDGDEDEDSGDTEPSLGSFDQWRINLRLGGNRLASIATLWTRSKP